MSTESGLPGHSINEGYPYNEIVTRGAMPNRLAFGVNEKGQILVNWNPEVFQVEDAPEALKDFFIHRLADYHEALNTAEGQIEDILNEMPFIPEEFDFELIVKPEDISDSPVRLYQSKHCPEYSLYRPLGDPNDLNWDPAQWVILKKESDNTFKPIPVNIPCHRIAYALFYALGIRIRPDMSKVMHEASTSAPVREEEQKVVNITSDENGNYYPGLGTVAIKESIPGEDWPVPPADKITTPGQVYFDVSYSRPGQHPVVKFERIAAEDEKDAITKAKFMVETDPNSGDQVHTAEFEHFKAIQIPTF
jgi:hypothetical protein